MMLRRSTMKQNKKIGLLIGATAVTATAWLAYCGYRWSWGPFTRLHGVKTSKKTGNAERYDLSHVQKLTGSPLEGKHLLFLGSSVTVGAAAQGVSFADYIGVRNGCTITKEAVSGTTLVDSDLDSYISRLKKIDTEMAADLFVCQLSTNDATQKKPLGTLSDSYDADTFDTSTVAGAIEYIIAYAEQTWSCPVVFYTNPQYDSPEYTAMVELLHTIQEKWNIAVIDLWNDRDFNAITEEQRSLYMADAIHPTKAGYLQWWTPYMENVIWEVIGNEKDR